MSKLAYLWRKASADGKLRTIVTLFVALLAGFWAVFLYVSPRKSQPPATAKQQVKSKKSVEGPEEEAPVRQGAMAPGDSLEGMEADPAMPDGVVDGNEPSTAIERNSKIEEAKGDTEEEPVRGSWAPDPRQGEKIPQSENPRGESRGEPRQPPWESLTLVHGRPMRAAGGVVTVTATFAEVRGVRHVEMTARSLDSELIRRPVYQSGGSLSWREADTQYRLDILAVDWGKRIVEATLEAEPMGNRAR